MPNIKEDIERVFSIVSPFCTFREFLSPSTRDGKVMRDLCRANLIRKHEASVDAYCRAEKKVCKFKKSNRRSVQLAKERFLQTCLEYPYLQAMIMNIVMDMEKAWMYNAVKQAKQILKEASHESNI